MTLIGESARQRDLRYRRVAVSQEACGLLDPPLHQPPMRRQARALLECVGEVAA